MNIEALKSRISSRRARRALLIGSALLFLNFLFSVSSNIYHHKREKFQVLQREHLQLLGILILEYYRNCGEFPYSLAEAENIRDCIKSPFSNENLKDHYNKPLFYFLTYDRAYLGFYANSTLFKTESIIRQTVLEVNPEEMNYKFVFVQNANLEFCCKFLDIH